MKTIHTAGKWKVSKENGLIFVSVGEEHSKCIANYDGTTPSDECLWLSNQEEAEANAKLIAHAPELLQMVYDLMKCVKRLTEDEDADKTLEAQWIGEAHELLHTINSEYYKNANA